MNFTRSPSRRARRPKIKFTRQGFRKLLYYTGLQTDRHTNRQTSPKLLTRRFWLIKIKKYYYICSVASLGLVSPGAATDGVTPIFSLKNLRPFLIIAVRKLITFLAVRPRLSTVLSKFQPQFFLFHSGLTPWRLSPGAVPLPPPVTTLRLLTQSVL